MDINQLRIARAALEANLRNMIQTECAAFRKITGMSPESISVDMLEVERMGQEERKFVVARVDVQLSI